MKGKPLELYDLQKLAEARERVVKVYEYYYGDSDYSGEVKRLETILRIIDQLMDG